MSVYKGNSSSSMNIHVIHNKLTDLVHLVDQVYRRLAEGVQFFGHACYLLELGQSIAYYADSLQCIHTHEYMYICR